MRLVLFALGLVLGVASTLAYALFANLPDAIPTSRPLAANPPITVIFGEPFLDALVGRAVLEVPGSVARPSNVRARFRGDTIVVQAEVDVLGRAARGEAVLRPVLRDGRMRVDVVATSLGALPVPAMDKRLEDQINERIRALLADMPVTLTGASIDPARGLVVTCRLDLPHSITGA